MKIILKNSYLLAFLISFSSCEKVIDIKVHESDKKYVMEGVITNEPGSCYVYLSRTQPFNQNNNFEKVSGAVVKIKDNGIETLLAETQPGVYHSTTLTGVPGHHYDLSVTINNQVFTATCRMPQPVKLDTLFIEPGPFGQFQFANVAYTDAAGVDNNYRFVQYKNGVQDPEIFWENDEFTDGQQILEILDTGVDKQDDPRNINSGDQVTIEMLGIDEAVYKYWYSLQSGGGDGSGGSAAPANPVTNVKGGALGYFSAQTVDRRMVIAP